ncbi:acyltransferase [Phycicoccus sp. CSK15P-2]|uniref:acyltransferase family protein n=1 Tax=Phycicoccus sp. CSK15P-2 TaxID=2807627 RepID=UPI00194E25CF|nr:acyltransferase [Phycicoccus sp. CSK15P-2]MBM6404457.1 acyltransferase [Phycicoccus sp. CSK15P-2]
MTVATDSTTATRTGPRLLYVDNLRTALTVLVVVHHAAVTYSTIPRWFYREAPTDASAAVLDCLLVLDQAFFMGAFFLVSGLFVPGSYDRKGGGRFLRDRLLRLGVPLLVWLLVLRAVVTVGQYTTARDDAAQQGVDMPYWQYYLGDWNLGPMWFVWVLFAFSALYALWRQMFAGGEGRTPATGRALGAAPVIGFVLGLSLLTYLWRIAVPMGLGITVMPTPGYLPQYAALFVVGVLAPRRGWLEGLPRTAARTGLAVAVVAAVALILVIAASGDAYGGDGTWQSLATATCESALAVGAVIGLLVLFRSHLGEQGRLRRFLSGHAYTVYLIHPVVLVTLGLALAGVQAPAVVKFVLLAVLGLPLCWALALPVRALPGARRVL